MIRKVGVMAAAVLTALALTAPATAKGFELTTISGPGIDGQVDLGLVNPEQIGAVMAPFALAGKAAAPPAAASEEGFTITWYSALFNPGGEPGSAVDEAVVYPGLGLVQIVHDSGTAADVFAETGGKLIEPGWYELMPRAATYVTGAVADIERTGLTGPAGYEFKIDTNAHGEHYGYWEPAHGAAPAPQTTAAQPVPHAPSESNDAPGWLIPGAVALGAIAVAAGTALMLAVRNRGTARPA